MFYRERVKLGLNKGNLNVAELEDFIEKKKIYPADPMTPYILKGELDVDVDVIVFLDQLIQIVTYLVHLLR